MCTASHAELRTRCKNSYKLVVKSLTSLLVLEKYFSQKSNYSLVGKRFSLTKIFQLVADHCTRHQNKKNERTKTKNVEQEKNVRY